MKYRAIIFDMDGTIVNSEPAWARATRELMQSRNILLNEEEQHSFQTNITGKSGHEICTLIKEMGNLKEEPHELMNEKIVTYQNIFHEHAVFIDGFEQFHAQLTNRSIPSAVATNANTQILNLTDKHLNLTKFFGDHLYCIDHVNRRCKPDPTLFLHAAEKLQVQPSDCLVIEDSMIGITAAKAAGMTVVGMNSAGQPHTLALADKIVNNYHELNLEQLT